MNQSTDDEKNDDYLHDLTVYVAGLFDAEGCHHIKTNSNVKQLIFSNSNKEMLDIVEYVLRMNGIIDYNVYLNKPKGYIDCNGVVATKDCYQLVINKEGQRQFWEIIGVYCVRLKKMYPSNMKTFDYPTVDEWFDEPEPESDWIDDLEIERRE